MTSGNDVGETFDLLLVGQPLSVTCESASVARALRAAWRPSLSGEMAAERRYFVDAADEIFVDGEPWTGGQDLFDVVPRLERCWLESVLARHPGATFLHGGGVVFGERLHVFVGESGAGKSSFTRELLRRGGTYLSDDMLLLESNRVRGLGRSVQFDPIPDGDPVPHYLLDCDVDSYRIGDPSRKGARVPLWTVDHAARAEFSLSNNEVVVVHLRQASSPRLVRVDALRRLSVLHAAALDTSRPYDGCLGWGPTFELEWAEPERELATLLDELSRLDPSARR